MIYLKDISKSYDDQRSFVIKQLSLHVEQGETVVLLGSSGSGKSTVLRMINRLIEPTQGQVFFRNQCVKTFAPETLRRSIGYVFQHGQLFPHMTIEDNIAIVLRLTGTSLKIRRHRAHELLEFMNLPPIKYAKRFPHQLSGGQQQRVGVARALASDPDCLLMDEPFGALDPLTREELQQEVLRLKQELNKTIVFVTHDLAEAECIGDRIAVLDKGTLIQTGSFKKLQMDPKSQFVEQLMAA